MNMSREYITFAGNNENCFHTRNEPSVGVDCNFDVSYKIVVKNYATYHREDISTKSRNVFRLS